MFWRRKKTSEYLSDPRYGPAGPQGDPHSPVPSDPAAAAGPGILRVADVFTITGRGTVVFGQVESGTFEVGQQVAIQRGGQVIATSQLSGIEAFHKVRQSAKAGDKVGLLLAGVERSQLIPGDQIVTTG